MKNKFYTILFLLVILGLTLYFPIRLHHSLNKQKVVDKETVLNSTFYNDAFYYLTVADNYAQTGMNTYDGINPTNGYHFLWQNILNVSFTGVDDKETQLQFAFILSLTFTLAAYLILFMQLFKITNSRFLALLTLFPGFFYMLFAVALGQHYSPWSIINGMESGLVLLLFATFLLVSIKFSGGVLSEKSFYTVSSIVLSLIVLARLDEVFLLISFIITILLYGKGNKVKNILFAGLVPALVIVSYLIYNRIEFGLMLPVSGLLKTSFGFDNLGHLLNSVLTGRSFDYLSGEHLFVRVLSLIIPLIFVPLFIRTVKKKNTDNNPKWIFILNVFGYYVVLKSVYIFFFVDFWHQGYWYFYNQVFIFNMMFAVLLRQYAPGVLKSKMFCILAIMVIVILSHSYFLDYEKSLISGEKLQKNNMTRINKLIAEVIPEGSIIEFDDGIIAYSTTNRCLSGFGLCIDKQGYDAIRKGELLDLAYKRGYRYLASVNYFKRSGETNKDKIMVNDFIKIPFFALQNEKTGKWRFNTVLEDSISGLTVINFHKK